MSAVWREAGKEGEEETETGNAGWVGDRVGAGIWHVELPPKKWTPS
jgi:hypothetical protein